MRLEDLRDSANIVGKESQNQTSFWIVEDGGLGTVTNFNGWKCTMASALHTFC